MLLNISYKLLMNVKTVCIVKPGGGLRWYIGKFLYVTKYYWSMKNDEIH